MNFTAVVHTYARFPVVLRLFLIVIFMTITAGVAIHFIEPETFPTVFDGVWWAIVTASTVGYGDYAPASLVGRILALFVIMFGIGVVSFFVTTFASTAITTRNAFKHGELEFKKHEHYIVIGWNERSKQMIEQLLKLNPQLEVVLIDQTLKESPINNHHVHFVRGNPLEDITLKWANIEKAHTAIITADLHSNEAEADARSIITLLTIKGLNRDVYTIVELLTPKQKNNCIRAGADEIIETSLLSSLAMVNSTLYHGITKVIHQLLDHENDHMLLYDEVPERCFGKTFQECSQETDTKHKLIIGVKRRDEVVLHPVSPFVLEKGDEFIIIKQ